MSEEKHIFPWPQAMEPGMTFLEYAAVAAMQGILAGARNLKAAVPLKPYEVAEAAVIQAKSLIAELAKG